MKAEYIIDAKVQSTAATTKAKRVLRVCFRRKHVYLGVIQIGCALMIIRHSINQTSMQSTHSVPSSHIAKSPGEETYSISWKMREFAAKFTFLADLRISHMTMQHEFVYSVSCAHMMICWGLPFSLAYKKACWSPISKGNCAAGDGQRPRETDRGDCTR